MKLAYLVGVALTVYGAMAMAGDDGIRVKAPHCEFRIPGDYFVEVSNSGASFRQGSSTDSRSAGGPGSISVSSRAQAEKEAEADAQAGLVVKQLGVERVGHLEVIRYSASLQAPGAASISYTVVRDPFEQLTFRGDAVKLAKQVASQCVATTDAKVVRAAERRARGCKAILPRARFDAFRDQFRSQPVFGNGAVKGWRVYPGPNRKVLSDLQLVPGDLLTHFCGVSLPDEIWQIDDDICCDAPADKSVKLGIERDGVAMEVTAPLPSSPAPANGKAAASN